jgi:chemotaxis protein CheY-P-specific phosphatase CheC
MEERKYTRKRLMLFKELGASAAVRAADAVSRMVGSEVPVSEINSGLIRLETLMESDHPEQEAVAVYTRVQGNAPGYAVFMFPFTRIGELVYSLGSHYSTGPINVDPYHVLQELGNMLISAALDEIADRSGMVIRPTEVRIVADMAGAIISSLVSMGLETTDRALTVGFHFGGDPGIMDGLFLYLPEPGSLEAIESACSRQDIRRIPMSASDMSWSDVQLLRAKLDQDGIQSTAAN